ncbi:phage integrase central domain-containing protein [Rahnella inusitata]|uniref:phage integrase central domain-containing protein n=1 Tax=Rahnella inusitata TaxID=58169 RepID=UPI0039BDCEED
MPKTSGALSKKICSQPWVISPVSPIKAKTVISALEPVSGRGALETVRRLSQRVNEIMIYAVNSGLIDANPASGIGRAFKNASQRTHANDTA